MPDIIIPRGSSAMVTVTLGSGGSGPSTDPGNRWYVEFAFAANNGASDRGWRVSWTAVASHAPVGSQVTANIEVPFDVVPEGYICNVLSLNVGNYIDLYRSTFIVAGGPSQGPKPKLCGGHSGGSGPQAAPSPGSSGGLSVSG